MKKLLTVFLALISAVLAAGDAPAASAPPSYLVILQRDTMNIRDHAALAPSRELRRELDRLGIVGGMLPLDSRITLDELKRYNFVVLGIDQSDFKLSLSEEQATNLGRLLAEYVRQGGGLFITRNGGYQFGQDITALNHILAPFGASVLDEQLVDRTNQHRGAGCNVFWTGNIVQNHPITQGVRGLFLPEPHGVYPRYTDFASPIRVDDNWQVLARMENSGGSYHRPKGGKVHPITDGSYSSAAPFLAVRDFGEGKVVLFPVTAPMYWQETHHPFFADGRFIAGDASGKPADGLKLIVNIMQYLSTCAQGKFGGFNSPYNFNAPPPPVLGSRGVDWDAVRFQSVYGRQYIGLIGAKSNLSGGKGTPQEFIAAAKAAGYNFIVFAEDFAQLTEEEYNTLKAICAAAKAPGFRAYPGFRYTDETGCQWLAFSENTNYPLPAWRSVRFPGRLINNNPLSRGWNWAPVVLLKSNLNPQEPWYKGNYKFIATHTYENGRLVDDSVMNYLALNTSRFCLSPVAVHLIDDPAQVASARNNGMQSVVRWPDDDVIKAYTGRYCDYRGSYVWFRPTYVTAGPEIRNFAIANFGTSDLAVKGNDRIRIYFNIHSPLGIREIILHDGDKSTPFRRFLPNGAKDFEVTFDSFHLDRRAFILEITDMAGNKCVSQEAWTSISESEFGRCSDNINTMPRGKWWGTPDGKHNMRALEDYMVSRDFRYCGVPIFNTIGPEGSHPRVRHVKVLSSRFCLIVDCYIDKHFIGKTSPNHDRNDDPLELRDNRFYSGVVRHIFFTGRQDSSFFTLVEGNFDIKRSFIDRPTVVTLFSRKNASNFTYTQLNGQCADVDLLQASLPMAIRIPRTGFAAIHPNAFSGAPGFFALSNNLTAWVRNLGNYNYSLNGVIGENGMVQFRAGTKLQYRYISVCGTFNSNPGSEFMTEMRDGLGIGCAPAYTVTASIGQFRTEDGILRLTPDNGSFRGTTTAADLPIDLPVIMSDLNPNWDAGIVYYGKNQIRTPMYSTNEYLQRSIFMHDVEHQDLLIHIPVLEDGNGYLQIETSRARDLFIGNLLICDAPQVRLTVVDTTAGKRKIEVHNPTDQVVRTTVRPARGFTLLGDFARTVEVQPGSSLIVELP